MTGLDNFSLTATQQWMQSILMDKLPPDTNANIENYIQSSKRLSAKRHLQIYRQSYIARLRDCMKKQFAALSYTLGEELFQQFADQYLEQYPSTNYTLNDLGKHFIQFLKDTRPDKDQPEKEMWPDFMIELADFEYELSLLFDAHQTSPDASIFKVFKHSFPISQYYLEFSHGKKPEMYLPEETFCKVTRVNYKMSITPITTLFFLENKTG